MKEIKIYNGKTKYHLELKRTTRYIGLTHSNNPKLLVKVGLGLIHGAELGNSIPICLNGIKISEAKVVDMNLTYSELGILLNPINDGKVPEFDFVYSEVKDLGPQNLKTLMDIDKTILDYTSFPYIKLNVKWR